MNRNKNKCEEENPKKLSGCVFRFFVLLCAFLSLFIILILILDLYFNYGNIFCVNPAEDLSDGEEVFPKEIAKWNSNDLMDKIEAADTEETPGI